MEQLSASSSHLVCILHIGPAIAEAIKPFNEQIWEKVQLAKAKRQSASTSKYSKICEGLKENYSNNDGYHSSCYKNFTAYSSREKMSTGEHSGISRYVLRSEVKDHTSTTSGVLESVCIFCGSKRKKVKQVDEPLGHCETFETAENIIDVARLLNHEQFLAKYENIDFIAKEVKYHHTCKRTYLNKGVSLKKSSEVTTEYKKIREAHTEAFEKLSEYLYEYIIQYKRSEFVSTIMKRYRRILDELDVCDTGYKVQNLTDKILSKYDQLKVSKSSNKEGSILHHKDITPIEARGQAFLYSQSEDHEVTQAALALRGVILNLVKTNPSLPTPITAEVLCKGQCSPPEVLLKFFRILSTGSEKEEYSESRKERYARTAASDAIFVTTNGMIKPAKQICLGMGMKTLTGSRKVIDVLNRFNHSINYHTIEEFETCLAENVSMSNSAIPDGLLIQSGLVTATAWDNYDENVETLSGRGSLHDTFGICYQNIPQEEIESHTQVVRSPVSTDTSEASSSSTQISKSGARRKRSYEYKGTSIDPYRKKPKISTFNFEIKNCDEPPNLKQVTKRDIFHMICIHMHKNIPSWIGFNTRITEDSLPRQKIGYMNNICEPITSFHVIKETLNRSQQVAKGCNQNYAIVTYDLAAAKPAMQIIEEESPTFDNVFVCFGAFHIELAYFASIGHIIAESGGPEILLETGVLASGSLNGFLAGKHYNRCKRLHPILANAMQILHFRKFLEENGPLPNDFMNDLNQMNENSTTEGMVHLEQSDSYTKLMDKYEDFTHDTRSGKHGTTAMYWMLYIDLVGVYKIFSRAVRTNDVNLFIYALDQMCDVFAAAGRVNYFRYMTLYVLKLLNIDHTHPGARTLLENGAMSVRRASRSFSRAAVDLTLEQTINADAASRLTGISALTTSEDGRHRWMITHAARSAITSNMLEMAGLKTKEDCSKELKKHRITKDNEDLQMIIKYISETLNPFGGKHDDKNLYCLTTGKAASESVKKELLNCRNNGRDWYNEFKKECFTDGARFEKRLPRRKTKNFGSDAIRTKMTVKENKIKEINCTRDLFGRLLCIAVENKIDLKFVLSYPLTPVPLSLAHVNGIKHNSQKSKVLGFLEKRMNSNEPECIDACLYDASFILKSTKIIPSTYGGLSASILKRILTAARVDFVCDSYMDEPTIKDMERSVRGGNAASVEYCITGPEQKTPKNFQELLNLSKFKRALFYFFIDEWKKDIYVDIFQNHILYVGLENVTFIYESNNNIVSRREVQELQCNHQEADTRLMWHIKHVNENLPGCKVSIRCNDTDIVIILLTHALSLSAHVWVDMGNNHNNTRRYIDITSLAQQLGQQLCAALPGYHAFTGNDYTASFFRKGKLRPLAIMEAKFINTFAALGESENLDAELVTSLESYVCNLYGKPNLKSVDDARYKLFSQHFAPKKNSKPLEKLKGSDSTNFPPCKIVLMEKIKRSNLVASIYKRANTCDPHLWKPENNGWILEDGKYRIKWFAGNQVPDAVTHQIEDTFEDEIDEELRITYDSASDESDNDLDL